jgi:16S rRNA (guanine966-N2)-methyltransferase
VISGSLKGKRLFSAKGLSLRPTSDRVKEAIFNILQDCFFGQNVLDLFAGTGALGIEALSRGARSALFIEESPKSLEALRKNIEACKLTEQTEVLAKDAKTGIKILDARRESFGLIFLDPPYGKGLADRTLKTLAASSILLPDSIIVAEHSLRDEFQPIPPLQQVDRRRYGSTQVSFFRIEKDFMQSHFNS